VKASSRMVPSWQEEGIEQGLAEEGGGLAKCMYRGITSKENVQH
jgi:hypothetical protein